MSSDSTSYDAGTLPKMPPDLSEEVLRLAEIALKSVERGIHVNTTDGRRTQDAQAVVDAISGMLIEHGRQQTTENGLCVAHGASNPETDCPYCDADAARVEGASEENQRLRDVIENECHWAELMVTQSAWADKPDLIAMLKVRAEAKREVLTAIDNADAGDITGTK